MTIAAFRVAVHVAGAIDAGMKQIQILCRFRYRRFILEQESMRRGSRCSSRPSADKLQCMNAKKTTS